MRTSRKILKNIFSLSFAEIANKGIIFITTAYLARVILPEGFGIIGLANSILVYFLLLVNLGFNTVGTREIAVYQEKTRNYVDAIITMRSLLAFVSYIALALITFFVIEKPENTKLVILICGLNLFSNAILLDWVYQGNEKMEVIAIRQVVTSTLNLLGILIFVHTKSDVVLAMSVTVASTMINALWMLFFYTKNYGRVKISFDFSLWKTILKDSIPITFSTFFITIINTLCILILSFFRNEVETGIYNAAYRVLLFVYIPSGIIQSAFFPVFSRSLTIYDRQSVYKKYFLFQSAIGVFIAISFFTFSEFVVGIVYGRDYKDTVEVLRYLMITSLIIYFNSSMMPPLIAWKKERKVLIAIALAAVVNIALNFALVPQLGPKGAALTTIFSELTFSLGLSIILIKTIQHYEFLNYLKLILFACISCGLGYLLGLTNIYALIPFLLSFFIYVFIIFSTKIITLQEIKEYIKK